MAPEWTDVLLLGCFALATIGQISWPVAAVLVRRNLDPVPGQHRQSWQYRYLVCDLSCDRQKKLMKYPDLSLIFWRCEVLRRYSARSLDYTVWRPCQPPSDSLFTAVPAVVPKMSS